MFSSYLERITEPPASFLFGVLIVAAAALIRLGLGAWFDPHDIVPFALFFPAVLLATVVGGLWPGVLALLLSTLISWWLIMPPAASFELARPIDLINVLIFTACGGLVLIVGEGYRRSQRRFKAAQDLAFDGYAFLAAIRDRDGQIVDFRSLYSNHAAALIFGRRPEDLRGRRLLELMPTIRNNPNGLPWLARVTETGIPEQREVYSSSLGKWFRTGVSKLDDGVALSFRDITEQKQNEQRLNLLVDELNHRIRNILASVHALVHQTRSETVEDYRARLTDRIAALSEVHDLIGRAKWQPIALAELLGQTISPYESKDERRFDLAGPHVDLPPKLALALHLAVHELATNANKYGALTAPRGRVHLRWEIAPSGDGRVVRITWIEEGGPPVAEPQHRGFGLRLITSALATEAQGEVELSFQPAGVRCEMKIPLPTPSA